MANYTKATDFASKDALLSGDSNKIIKGTEIDDEFSNIQTAVNSKADALSPTLAGTPLAPTATAGTNTTQIATTAFVGTAVTNERTATATLTNKTITGTFTGPLTGNVTGNVTGNATTATSLSASTWTVTESGGVLYFAVSGVNKAKLDASGNLTVIGNITAYGTI